MKLFVLLSLILGVIMGFPDAKAVADTSTSAANTMVNTLSGKIQGSIMKSRLDKDIFAFRGIPYAKPPVKELRFKPPEPMEPWNTTFDATKDGPVCPQFGDPKVTEDCLVLNIYTTALKKDDMNPKRPVIVFFHAGGFYSGSGQSIMEGPEYLMDKEVVLVVPNNRLGSLGFISTGDKEAPGNNGFKDQVLALRWIKQNIGYFGGDPDLVTIVGYSAGGISVCLHMVSEMSRGLFHHAVAMSGSCTTQLKVPFHQINLAKKQAKLLGCPDTNSSAIMECLQTKPAEKFANSFPAFQEFGTDPILIWNAVIEPDVGQERFLSEDPTYSYLKGKQAKVPLITGVTEYEFAGQAYAVVNNATLLEEINKDFERIAAIAFIYERNDDVSKALKKFYFDDKDISNQTVAALGEMYAEGVTGFGVHRLAHLVAKSNISPVYYYKFVYKGRYSHFYLPNTNNTPLGAVHHDELMYLFHPAFFPLFKESDPENRIIEYLTSMWVNFARTGKPTPDSPELWKLLTLENNEYLNIDEILETKENMFEERYKEWDKNFPIRLQSRRHSYHD